MDRDKEKVVALPSADKVEEEAAEWLITLSRDDVSEREILEFRAWSNRHALNRASFERLAALWEDLGELKALDDFAESVAASVDPHRSFSGRWLLAGVAASAALVLVLSIDQFANRSPQQFENHEFATAVGEQTTVTLSDGSEINLNTNTYLQVAYSAEGRDVALVRGEAHFTVAKSERRPFRVHAGDRLVNAVGTAFTVRLRPDASVEVTVEEGRVALSIDASSGQPSGNGNPALDTLELGAGANAVYSGHVEKITQLGPSEVTRKLSWRQGVLAYAGEPLSEVVADISRYTPIRIEIEDPELGSREIGGYFRIGAVEEMFESLELNFGLTIERLSDEHVRISRRPDSEEAA